MQGKECTALVAVALGDLEPATVALRWAKANGCGCRTNQSGLEEGEGERQCLLLKRIARRAIVGLDLVRRQTQPELRDSLSDDRSPQGWIFLRIARFFLQFPS